MVVSRVNSHILFNICEPHVLQDLLYIRSRKESDSYVDTSSLLYLITYLFSLIRKICSVSI